MLDSIHTWLQGVSIWMIWAVAGTVGFVGLSLLLLALFADALRGRGKQRRRCPKCWYDMSGKPDSLRCPECGREAKREYSLHRARRSWRWAFVGLLLILFIPGGYIAQGVKARGWYWLLPKYKTVSEVMVAGCRVRQLTPRDPNEYGNAIEIKRGGTKVLLEGGMHYELGSMPWKPDGSGRDASKMVGFGTDITGGPHGIPDLIIEEYTGGAHCCTIFHIYELGDPPRLLQEIDTSHGGGVFEDLDGDGLPELRIADWTFAYWHTSFAGSPAPNVILKWQRTAQRPNIQFSAAGDLMRKPAPPAEELHELAQKLRADPNWTIGSSDGFVDPVDLWRTMLDLIYTGHMDLAWKLYDDSWPPDKPGKTAFLAEFVMQFASSPYAYEIKKMNGPTIDSP